jgi:hypothetical protein
LTIAGVSSQSGSLLKLTLPGGVIGGITGTGGFYTRTTSGSAIVTLTYSGLTTSGISPVAFTLNSAGAGLTLKNSNDSALTFVGGSTISCASLLSPSTVDRILQFFSGGVLKSYIDKNGKYVGPVDISLSDVVTLSTAQTLTGKKTFPSDGVNCPVFVGDDSAAYPAADLLNYHDATAYILHLQSSGAGTCTLVPGTVYTNESLGGLPSGLVKNTTGTGVLEAATSSDLAAAGAVTVDGTQTLTGKKVFPADGTNAPVFHGTSDPPSSALVLVDDFDTSELSVYSSGAGECVLAPGAVITNNTLDGWLYTSSAITRQGTSVNITGRTSSITTENIISPAGTIFYRVSVYVVATASTVGTLTVTIGWTDAKQAQTSTVITTGVIAAGGFATATIPIMTSGANPITYATVVGGTALTYNLHIRLEQVSIS